MTLPLGGDAATAFFRPLEVTGTVRKVGGGVDPARRTTTSARSTWAATVVFDVGPVTLLISELRGVAGNVPDVYRAFGIEPARLQDGGAQDRLELPVLRADHLAGDPGRHARAGPVGHLHPAVAADSAADLSRSIRSRTGATAPAGARTVRRASAKEARRVTVDTVTTRAGGTVT